MIYNLDFLGIGDAIVQACRTFVGWLGAMIYTLIEYMYHVFELLARAEIIEDSFVQLIYTKVGYILGIFMLFKLTFSLIQSLIEPEKLTDKKSGYVQIIKRSIISIVLLGITPGLFREAFKIQNLILDSNVVYKLIAGSATHYKSAVGRQLAGNLFLDFVTDVDDPILHEGMVDDSGVNFAGEGNYIERFQDNTWENFENGLLTEGYDFSDAIDYLAIKENGKYVIELNWFLLLIVGIVVFYMIAIYCIQVAVRVVQLAYLQLIAPVPILSYISDPEGSFKNWTKQCLTTYLDLFIRLAIIYFVMTLISEVLYQFKQSEGILYETAGLANESNMTIVIIKVFIIIGLLIFGKKVPELLKDLFPNMGGGAAKFSFGLKPPKEATGLATLGAGVAVGGIAGMASGLRHGEGWRGKLAGMGGGFFRGAASARTKGNIFGNAKKGMANVRAANARAYERHHDGSTFFGRMAPVHASREAKRDERELKAYSDYDALLKSIDAESDKDAGVQLANESLQSVLRTGRTKKDITWTDSSTGTSYTFTAGQRISQSDMQYAIRASQDDIKKERKNFVERELNKERTSAGSGNQVVVAATKASEKLRVDGVNEGYQGFGKETMDLSSSETTTNIVNRLMDENKKSTKKETTSMTSKGGTRYEEVERHKANANYQHRDK